MATDRMVLANILKEHQGKTIIIFPPLIDWNVPLFQRPHHLALNLARLGYLYFYCTPNMYDDYPGFVRKEDNLYITDCYDELLELVEGDVLFHVYAQNPYIQLDFIDTQIAKGRHILYEYIDEIHSDLGLNKNSVIERHISVLSNDNIIVVATATKLMREVLSYRNYNCALVGNGVDISHFSQQNNNYDIPSVLLRMINNGKPIIGYFGALASWFDYELILKLGTERPNYNILLIGWDYDNSVNCYHLNNYHNVTVLGPIEYRDLPRYAKWFTVSTIPFRINEVTESTSPIKLFEYMALGHPIVTTDLPECRKYQSVLIATNHDDFVQKVDKAIALSGDNDYRSVLRTEAESNSWESKAKAVDYLIKQNLLYCLE